MVEMARRTIVFLREPEGAPELPEDEQERIQASHLAYLGSMRKQGHMVTAGPFGDRFDEQLRGMCIYTTGLAETRALAEADPAVTAGLLSVQVVTWVTPAGELFDT